MTTHLPGPRDGVWGLKNLLEFQNDPLGFLSDAAHDYGDIIEFRFGPYHMYILKHPDYIHEALVKNAKLLEKWERQVKVFRKSSGNGTFSSSGDFWKRQRRLIMPAFHTQRIKNYISLIIDHTQRMFDRWADGGEFEISEEMHTVTMGIISEILFDVKDIETEAKGLSEAIDIISEMVLLESSALMPIPDWVPTKRNRQEDHAMKFLDNFIMNIIKKRRVEGSDHGDVLSALLQAVDEEGDGGQMTDQQVRDELLTLFIAGHETTALALTWTLYLLSENLDIQEQLYAEVNELLEGEKLPTLEDLETMTYTDKVLKESMRLYPPAWTLVLRSPTDNLRIAEHTIPKNSVLFISPWVMHRDARYFENPSEFDPERFNDGYRDRIPHYAYFPFGGGPRVCSGQHLAMMEAEVLLASMIERYQFELLPNQEIIPEPFITIRPKNGVRMKVSKR